MSYTALYRKFRPQTFADVKGQDHIVTTLKNQISSGRLGHAYLFTGTRGTGKTTVAKILARTVNCENPGPDGPCCECASCQSISDGTSMNVIEMDAASNNGVDSVRQIIEEVTYSPVNGRYKVYIVDEVHMLSAGAFNALLKTLEEPPEYVIFILATTEVHKIPITILSRCQRYDFKRIGIDTISGRLKELTDIEKMDVEDRALRYVARVADGSMRDALSLLDQCAAFNYGECLTYDKALNILGAVDTSVFSDMLRLIIDNNVIGSIEKLEEIVMQGRELGQFVVDFTWYLRNLMLVKSCGDGFAEDILDVSTEHLKLLKEEAELLELSQIFRYITIFSELSTRLKYASQKRITIEMTLIRLMRPEMDSDTSAYGDRIKRLEEKVEKGVTVNIANSPAPTVPSQPKTLPKSIPDDIKRIVSEWPQIVGRTEHLTRTLLQKAKLSLGETGNLLICVDDKVKEGALNDPDKKTEIERLLSDYVEKQVSIEVRTYQKEINFDDQFANLQSLIGMNIDIEEE